ncbi:hypothetical protein GYMLUDRAFT_783245 [Collybiopsis luxurians FD-317 M1]|uniref:Uncharacterized protein n=1 Tax=Collybiopsis luxurians FD-317 M1 TaxID=944289 RepID=A0A0D0CMT8_9AGAR|nr:hypothetical protein GYMLUDRAFT_783245 [Collybiopsis luxurians FD-317 M1]
MSIFDLHRVRTAAPPMAAPFPARLIVPLCLWEKFIIFKQHTDVSTPAPERYATSFVSLQRSFCLLYAFRPPSSNSDTPMSHPVHLVCNLTLHYHFTLHYHSLLVLVNSSIGSSSYP